VDLRGRRVTGARARHESGRTDPLRVQALIGNRTQPALSTIVSVTQVEGRDVLVIDVPDSPLVVGTTGGLYVRRALASDGRPTCLPYHAHEMLAHEIEMLARLQARNSQEELRFGLLRVPVAAYSETAFREALANALIHRDYTRPGAAHVQLSPDQLEISSPGGFPSGVRLGNLLVTPPHRVARC